MWIFFFRVLIKARAIVRVRVRGRIVRVQVSEAAIRAIVRVAADQKPVACNYLF